MMGKKRDEKGSKEEAVTAKKADLEEGEWDARKRGLKRTFSECKEKKKKKKVDSKRKGFNKKWKQKNKEKTIKKERRKNCYFNRLTQTSP